MQREREGSEDDTKARRVRGRKPKGDMQIRGAVRIREAKRYGEGEYEEDVGRETKWTKVQARNEGV